MHASWLCQRLQIQTSAPAATEDMITTLSLAVVEDADLTALLFEKNLPGFPQA